MLTGCGLPPEGGTALANHYEMLDYLYLHTEQ
jgi:hypothetical protein